MKAQGNALPSSYSWWGRVAALLRGFVLRSGLLVLCHCCHALCSQNGQPTASSSVPTSTESVLYYFSFPSVMKPQLFCLIMLESFASSGTMH